MVAVLPPALAPAQTLTTLYSFLGHKRGGAHPLSGVLIGPGGRLYGTTYGGGPNDARGGGEGVAYELRPAGQGVWKEHVIWYFGGFVQPSRPQGGLIFGSNGVLFGTSYDGGAYVQGSVVQLTPPVPPEPPGHVWTMTDLYDFDGGSVFGDPGEIASTLVMDANGVMYGTGFSGGPGGAFGSGGAFSITPPATPGGSWTEAYIYGFSGGGDGAAPEAGMIIDSNGNLYGTTSSGAYSSNGTVYELIPPASSGGGWGERTLVTFYGGNGANPVSTLLFGPGGVLYGTASNGGAFGDGVVFSVTPTPTGGWTQSVLYSFTGQAGDGANPMAGLVADSNGNLYGTTYNGGTSALGTVFELSPPAIAGGAWTETVLHSFAGQPSEGANPHANLVFDRKGLLYGTTEMGGVDNYGTVFSLRP